MSLMTTRHVIKRKTSKKPKQKAKLKLVGYMEERDIADRAQQAWRDKGFDSSSVLREAFRAVLNGTDALASEWTIKESVLAKRVGLNKVTIARMRHDKKLVDESGPLWKQIGSNFLYDVERTRAFFMKTDNVSANA